MKFFNKLKPLIPVFILLAIELVLFYANYVPKTYFLGWDNLFPELNFGANIQRSIFAIWEQYRGLGFLDGMSFAANLPHYVFLYLTSLFIPQSLLRYFSIFFLHFLGGAGMYFLLNKLFSANPNKKILSFLGALFYLFNLATIQMFYAPYELFAIHFAFLPWLILFAINYLADGSKRNLTIFAGLSFLGASQAHVPTIFIVYVLALFSVLVFHLFNEGKNGFKKIIIILLITFTMNAFWGLPYAYFGLTSSKNTTESKINQMANETIYLNNKARGNLIDVAMLKGFWFDYVDYQPDGGHDYIMPAWRKYTQTVPFFAVGVLFFLLSLAGIAKTIKKRDRKFYPFVITFLFSFLMLGNDIPILNSVFNSFYNYVPLFAETFRFTFTKFSILYAFSFSIFLTVGLSVILEFLSKFKYWKIVLPLGFIAILLYYCFPSFQSQFIYKNLKVNIPSDYFQLVNYFNKQNTNERIALLPQDSYWGWTYTNWDYRGSGFIWYGLPQPSLDGSTFPWSKQNENYYWELDQAINSDNTSYFGAVLQKYQINWIVLDHSVVSQYSSKATLGEDLQNLLESSPEISLASSFGKVDVYRVRQNTQQNNFISLVSNLPKIGPTYNWNNFDTGFLENGSYISENADTNIYYPFRSLFTGRQQNELEFKLSDKGSYFSFKSSIPQNLSGSTLVIPKINNQEMAEVNASDLTKEVFKYPQIYINNVIVPVAFNPSGDTKITLPDNTEGTIEVRVPKIEGYSSYDSKIKGDLFNRFYKTCNPFATGTSKQEKISENGTNILRLSDLNYSNCFDFDLPNFSQRVGYLVTVKSRNLEGQSLLLSIINKTSQKPDFESNLPKNNHFASSYFVIPPMQQYGLGYNLYFDNVSLGNVISINDLSGVQVNQIPYQFLTGLKIETNTPLPSVNAANFTAFHPNPSLYTIKLNQITDPNTTLILSQSFDSGWKAYAVNKLGLWNEIFPFLFGEEIKQHVLVNNWENGWILNNNQNTNIVIVYLPQYLEYLGFVILILPVLIVALRFLASKRPRKILSIE